MDNLNEKHYDEDYFNWQKDIGEFGAWANKTKFEKYIQPDDKVVDFGCGGGFLLKALNCSEKMGVEINDTARSFAEKYNNIMTVKDASELKDSYYDVIISNHALEHCNNPYEELLKLHKKLKTGGRIIFVVPQDGVKAKWKPDDVNMHIYSWSPMNLGNLFTVTGFNVIDVHPYIHKWPPMVYRKIAKCGRTVFDIACRIYARFTIRYYTQTRIVAQKR